MPIDRYSDFIFNHYGQNDYRNLKVRCIACGGRGLLELMGWTRMRITDRMPSDINEATITCHVGICHCIRCFGTGWMKPTIPRRIAIKRLVRDSAGKQHEITLGTVGKPDLAVRDHPLVDLRPGDYIPHADEKGELYYLASSMLGQGDVYALCGFIPGECDYEQVQKHIDRCKERAYKYCDRGDMVGAHSSFSSDMRKNTFTAMMDADLESMSLIVEGKIKTAQQYRKWLEDF